MGRGKPVEPKGTMGSIAEGGKLGGGKVKYEGGETGRAKPYGCDKTGKGKSGNPTK